MAKRKSPLSRESLGIDPPKTSGVGNSYPGIKADIPDMGPKPRKANKASKVSKPANPPKTSGVRNRYPGIKADIPETDPKPRKASKAPKASKPANPPKIKVQKPKKSPRATKPINPSKVPLAVPKTPIEPRVENRVSVFTRPSASKVPVAVPKTPIEPRVENRLRVFTRPSGRSSLPVVAPPHAISPKSLTPEIVSVPARTRIGRVGKPLGYIAASMAVPEKFQPILSAGMHASTAKEAAAAIGKGLSRRALPWVGTAFAAAEVAAAVGAARGWVKAEKEAQANREAMAVKYASPLTHQRRLREREAAKRDGGFGSAFVQARKDVAVPKPAPTPAKSSASVDGGFGSAFAQARKAGMKEFEYKGKKYHTRLASEIKAPAKKAETTAQPQYDSQKYANNISIYAPDEKPAAPKANFGAFLRKHHPKLGSKR